MTEGRKTVGIVFDG